MSFKSVRLFMLVGLSLLALLVTAPVAQAAEFQGDDQVNIGLDEVIADDLYVGATEFVLNGTVQGDLIVGGTTIVINGTVEGDLWAGGQTVIINGTVGDDARVAGSAIELGESAQIGGDLLVGAYSLHLRPGSVVEADLLVGGLQVLLEGEVGQEAFIGVGAAEINGRFGGDVSLEVGDADDLPATNPFAFMPDGPTIPTIAPGLTWGPDAAIGGDLRYTAVAPVDNVDQIVAGEVAFNQAIVASDNQDDQNLEWLWGPVRRLIGLLLVGLLLVWLAPNWLKRSGNLLEMKPLPAAGWGTAVYFGVPIILIALFVITILLTVLFNVIGLGNIGNSLLWIVIATIFAFLIAFIMVLLYLTKLIVGYLAGNLLLSRLNPALAENMYVCVVVGILLIVLLLAIPIVGSLLNLLIAILGVGTLFILLRQTGTLPGEKSPPVEAM